jgi:hypothetical protein
MGTSNAEDEYLAAAQRRDARWRNAGIAALALGGLIAAGILLFVSTNLVEVADDRALEAIHASGLRSPKLGGADALACDESESSRHFTATSSQGKRVEGTVCCGLTRIGKGCTIRWGR